MQKILVNSVYIHTNCLIRQYKSPVLILVWTMNWLYSYKVTVRPTHENKSVNKLAALRRHSTDLLPAWYCFYIAHSICCTWLVIHLWSCWCLASDNILQSSYWYRSFYPYESRCRRPISLYRGSCELTAACLVMRASPRSHCSFWCIGHLSLLCNPPSIWLALTSAV